MDAFSLPQRDGGGAGGGGFSYNWPRGPLNQPMYPGPDRPPLDPSRHLAYGARAAESPTPDHPFKVLQKDPNPWGFLSMWGPVDGSGGVALPDLMPESNAMRNSAMGDRAMGDLAMGNSAMRESGMRESAMEDTGAMGDTSAIGDAGAMGDAGGAMGGGISNAMGDGIGNAMGGVGADSDGGVQAHTGGAVESSAGRTAQASVFDTGPGNPFGGAEGTSMTDADLLAGFECGAALLGALTGVAADLEAVWAGFSTFPANHPTNHPANHKQTQLSIFISS